MINQMNETPGATDIDARFRVLQTIWIAFLGSIAAYALVAYFTRGLGDSTAGNNPTLLLVFLALGISNIGFSFLLKNKFLAQAANEQRPGAVQTAYILALAICEGAAIFGLLGVFLTGATYSYLLFLVAATGMLLHMPRRDHLLAATYRGM